jgi:DNA-binding LytR/AlgR family response regulator
MITTKLVLLEDDPFYQAKIESMLEGSQFETVQVFTTTEGVEAYLKLNPVDVFLSDLFISGKPKGAELVEKLHLPKTNIVVISTSADIQLFNNLKTKIFGYIVKPFHSLSLLSMLNAAASRLTKNNEEKVNETLFLTGVGGRKERVSIYDIVYIEVEGNYSFVYTSQQKYALKLSLSKLILQVGGESHLLRIHHKYAVNPRFIETFTSDNINLFGGKQLSVSATFRAAVLEALG